MHTVQSIIDRLYVLDDNQIQSVGDYIADICDNRYATECEELIFDKVEEALMSNDYHTMTHDQVFNGVRNRLDEYRRQQTALGA